MSLTPLLNAAPAIPLHAAAAIAAFALGLVQLLAPKGTLPHRTLGWIWVALMVVVAGSSFWIHEIRLVGPWSPIHLLSIFSLVMLVVGVAGRTGPQCEPAQEDDGVDFCRRADHCGLLRLHARTHHACGGFRAVKRGIRKRKTGTFAWPVSSRQRAFRPTP